MKEIVKVLLQEGIDEETIHEVLDILEVSYEFAYKPTKKFKEKASALRDKVKKEGGEKERVQYEDALKEQIKHQKKYDSWEKGKKERMLKATKKAEEKKD